MELLNKWIYKLTGRKVPVLQVKDVENGKVKTLVFEHWVDNPNTLLEAWNVIGAEKRSDAGPIELIDHGARKLIHITHKGQTVNLYVEPMADVPDRSKVIGSLLVIDVLGEILDLGKSLRNTFVGFLLGCLFWASIGGPILTGILS